MNEPPQPEDHAVLALRLSRLILCKDDADFELFRRQHLAGAPHATVGDLRTTKELVTLAARQLSTGSTEGFRRIEEAVQTIAGGANPPAEPLSQSWEEITNIFRAPEAPSTGPDFAPPSHEVHPVAPSQHQTAALPDDLHMHLRAVDATLCWPVATYARLCAELEQNDHDQATVWQRFGVADDPRLHAAVHCAWRDRLRTEDLKRRYQACLRQYRQAATPTSRNAKWT